MVCWRPSKRRRIADIVRDVALLPGPLHLWDSGWVCIPPGERFQFEKAVPRCRRLDRPISVTAVPFGPGIGIRRSCKLLGAMLRALCALPWWPWPVSSL